MKSLLKIAVAFLLISASARAGDFPGTDQRLVPGQGDIMRSSRPNYGLGQATQIILNGTTLTLGQDTCGKTILTQSGSATTITLPGNVSPPCSVLIDQVGAGAVTTSASGSATLVSGAGCTTGTNAQHALITLLIESNTSGINAVWNLGGFCK